MTPITPMRLVAASALVLTVGFAACGGDDKGEPTLKPVQIGIEDAGDADGDGTDECILWATEDAEYEACYRAGSEPTGSGPGIEEIVDNPEDLEERVTYRYDRFVECVQTYDLDACPGPGATDAYDYEDWAARLGLG
jgi:hypothetical protein